MSLADGEQAHRVPSAVRRLRLTDRAKGVARLPALRGHADGREVGPGLGAVVS